MRRTIDLLFAIFCLTVFGPLILLIAILIKLDSQGPILYRSKMVGQQGKVFSLYRFRTMSREDVHFHAEQRLTRMGRFIRNISLDHLPMLIHLLRGDLTLVGPRPMEVNVVNLQDPVWQQYFQVKPGLFNYAVLKLGKLWTPTRETNPTLNQELELEYLQKRSVKFDIQVFLNFLRAFIVSKGNIKARGESAHAIEDKLK